ncbi:MAG: glycosyltransferase family 2 protein [Candidatus Omnitrophica bacterium]|nr:glycosyltransferase family 2 protein [Candidatus Omnitrophota bacterium]MCA9447340.1 glycosyltransferase family 2 protein [Candidatus Omnitrophota bacterium]MCB9782836.1 glycosyltransferase family 2 protein [Candidatus Omnitrophota bacterium]
MERKGAKLDISIVIPAHNEEENLDQLRANLVSSLEPLNKSFEVIFIDDGSSDSTYAKMAKFSREDPRFKGIRMRKNVGKASALAAGFDAATGDIVFTMDADNQDDPSEIPRFLEKLEEGHDLVSGWKRTRHDPSQRVIASRIFNGAIRFISRVPLHDFNCGFKAYRAEVVKSLTLYGEWHRFIPVLAAHQGYRIAEIEVQHHPRVHGKSRYGWERYFRGFVDLLTILFLSQYSERPAHLFSGIGFVLGGLGFVISLYLSILHFAQGTISGKYPMLSLGVLLMILGAQFFFTGLIAELFVSRNPPQRHRTAVSERVGFGGE